MWALSFPQRCLEMAMPMQHALELVCCACRLGPSMWQSCAFCFLLSLLVAAAPFTPSDIGLTGRGFLFLLCAAQNASVCASHSVTSHCDMKPCVPALALCRRVVPNGAQRSALMAPLSKGTALVSTFVPESIMFPLPPRFPAEPTPANCRSRALPSVTPAPLPVEVGPGVCPLCRPPSTAAPSGTGRAQLFWRRFSA